MRLWILLFAAGAYSLDTATTVLRHIDEMDNVAVMGDAHHREEKWRSYRSSATSIESDLYSSSETSSGSVSSSYTVETSSSSDASSAETSEKRQATKTYRECNTCPHEMMKKHTNRGIKWICAGYQRARRTFKSECMMRYRNCQDGTMFVKLHDHRCKNDTFHGKHWFYVYKV